MMEAAIEKYIESHISPEPDYLKEIDRQTNLHHINGRMCSGHIQGRLLKMLVAMIKPKKILELGTFTGYSALCMAEALLPGAEIITIEADEELKETINGNLSKSHIGEKVKLIIGDALETMKNFEAETFGLVTIDADKRQYSQYLVESLRILKPGGFIIADNTLWDGHVTETGKHSSQTQGIIDFNKLASGLPGIDVAIIPIRDGITLIRKNT